MKTGYYFVVLENGYTTIGLYTVAMGWTYGEYNRSTVKFGIAPVLFSWHSEFKGFNHKPY